MSADLRTKLLARVDELLKVCDGATAGPWQVERERCVWGGQGFYQRIADLNDFENDIDATLPDLAFIAQSRTALPAALRALRGEIERHTRERCLTYDKDSWPCPTLTAIAKEILTEER